MADTIVLEGLAMSGVARSRQRSGLSGERLPYRTFSVQVRNASAKPIYLVSSPTRISFDSVTHALDLYFGVRSSAESPVHIAARPFTPPTLPLRPGEVTELTGNLPLELQFSELHPESGLVVTTVSLDNLKSIRVTVQPLHERPQALFVEDMEESTRAKLKLDETVSKTLDLSAVDASKPSDKNG